MPRNRLGEWGDYKTKISRLEMKENVPYDNGDLKCKNCKDQ